MKVKMIDSIAGRDYFYRVGRTYDIPKTKAVAWINAGYCQATNAKRERATAEREMRTT